MRDTLRRIHKIMNLPNEILTPTGWLAVYVYASA